MEDLSSMFHVDEETVESLKIKLLHAQLKLKSANDLTTQLLNLVHQISEDRDRFKTQFQALQNQTTMSSSSLMNYNTESFSFQNNNNTLSTTTNLSPFLESATSSSDFSINNNIDNLGFFNEQHQQPLSWNYSQFQQQQDPLDLVFQNLVRGKVLPEKGKLVESIKKAGPLLQTLLFTGPLPTWRVPPPPHQQIQDDVAVPDFSSFGFGVPNSSMVGFGGNQFNYQENDQVTTLGKRQRIY